MVIFIYQRNFIEKSEIEEFVLLKEIDNLQTRSLAGEEYMSGECDEKTYQKAIENIQNKFAVVVPTEEVDYLLALLANHFDVNDIAYSRAQITGAKVITKDDKELCQKILEKNYYDQKLYEFVKNYWNNWKQNNIESFSDNISPENNYMVITSSFYEGNKKVEYMNLQQIEDFELSLFWRSCWV